MGNPLIDKYNLNLAGEYRVAAELCLRGLFTSVTYGNKKGADLYAIGENRKTAVIEVKASQSSRFVTSLYQKYKSADTQAPDFWVLYSVKLTATGFAERFFVLSHRELSRIQGEATSARRSSGVKQDGSSGRMKHLRWELPTTTFAWRPARCLAEQLG